MKALSYEVAGPITGDAALLEIYLLRPVGAGFDISGVK
jgi:hypothetical protein